MSEPVLSFTEERLPHDSLASFRKKAWDIFCDVGYPTRKIEAFQYVPLAKLYAHDFEIASSKEIANDKLLSMILPECKHSYVTFINGKFYPELSNWPSVITVNSLQGAMKNYAIFLQNRMQISLKQEKNPFALLNAAFHDKGIFLYLSPDTSLDTPLQILNLTVNSEPGPKVCFPRIHAFLGKNSSLKLFHTSYHLGEFDHYWTAPLIDFVIEENASLEMSDIVNSPFDSWFFGDYRYLLKKEARLSSVDFSIGSKTVRRDYKVTMQGARSEAKLSGLSFLAQERQEHTHVLVEHLAPECTSSQLFKKVVGDNAKASFEGKIFVEKIAQKTEAYQLNNNLLLNEQTTAFSKPNLEIYADDVKASHGATFGQLSEEEMFYLQSRGINKEKAKKMMILAFCSELMQKLNPAFIQKSPLESICTQ